MSKWETIGSYTFSTPEGDQEIFHLEYNREDDAFKLRSDFGNISIELDKMTGHQFFKDIYKDIEAELDLELFQALEDLEKDDN